MSIICGTDFSKPGGDALEVAVALATLRGDREVVLVHALDAEPGSVPADELAALRARLAAQAAAARGAGPSVRSELVQGPPDRAVVDVAQASAGDLIVIAAHSRAERAKARLGTTAARVIATTPVPVIVVRDPAPWLRFARGERPLRVLLGIDDSATCDLGVQWTLALAKRGAIDIVLGAIYYPDDAAAYYGLPARSLVETDPEIERLIQRDLLRRFGNDGKAIARSVTARARRGLGRIGDHIIELAQGEQVDAIVVGTSQRTGLGRLGSVSSVIVEDAPESVVCVPPQTAVATHGVPMLERALVATDLSQFANRAVPYAFALTRADGEVFLVHVIKDDAEIDEAALLEQLAALAPAGARQTLRVHLVRGEDTATVIAQCAARFGVDVICIASHGRSGLSRALVGSVADSLLRATRLPVLVLRPA